nr:MAG TPA: hypothetical protein [Bacteriophage sp.]
MTDFNLTSLSVKGSFKESFLNIFYLKDKISMFCNSSKRLFFLNLPFSEAFIIFSELYSKSTPPFKCAI